MCCFSHFQPLVSFLLYSFFELDTYYLIKFFDAELPLLFPEEVVLVNFTVSSDVLLIPDPFGDGGMVEDHGAPEARQFPRALAGGRKDRKIGQRASDTKSQGEQCRMSGDVLGRMTTDAT